MPLLDDFIEAGLELVHLGCDGIATNCGFLVNLQHKFSAGIGIPVATSSLLQASAIQQTLPAGRTLGILTISQETLSAEHLKNAGISSDTPIVGTGAKSHFSTQILNDANEIDFHQARHENVEAALKLVTEHPQIGAILLECTNMVPFAADIRQATGRPVYSMYTYVLWFHSALQPRRFNDNIDDTRY